MGRFTSIGTWQKDIAIGNSGTIYGLGYLLGTIDFLQGDTWASGAQCDNTYVLKIIDSGNNAVVDRHSAPFFTSSSASTYENKKGYILKNEVELNELIHKNSIRDFYLIDFSGRIIYQSTFNIINSYIWNSLANGCYYLKGRKEVENKTMFICK